MRTINEIIAHLNPCEEAIEWLGKRTSIKKAWNECNQANWMLWLATHFVGRKIVVLSACDCAETVLKYIHENEDRPKKAIDTVRLWAKGKANIKEVERVTEAAGDAADVASDASNDAVDAAFNAISAAFDAAAVVFDANIDAAYTAGDAAANAAAAASATSFYTANYNDYKLQRSKNLKKLASLVRKRITAEMIEESLLKGA